MLTTSRAAPGGARKREGGSLAATMNPVGLTPRSLAWPASLATQR
jgi:hypothetical protein